MDTTAANACHSRFGNTITRLAAGFTLVELLVVVAGMALLTGLLLPALTKGKQSASSVQCKSNLRQLQLAAEMYASDYEGYFPPNREGTLFGYWQGIDGSWVLGNAKSDTNDLNLRKGVLWPYLNTSKVYGCPADQSVTQGTVRLRRWRSYTLSHLLNHYFIPGNGIEHPGAVKRSTEACRPTAYFAFVCTNERTIDSGAFALQFLREPNTWGWYVTPGERHGRGADLSFLDSHIEHHRWLYTPKPANGAAAVRAINAADRQDLLWLLERSRYWDWAGRKEPRL